MSCSKWFLLLLGVVGTLPAAAAELPTVTLSLPGLFAPDTEEETRELWGQQLAASLEGKGFIVLDADALAARDIEVHPLGCHSPLPPLCGAGPGVDQVIIGSVMPAETEGAWRVVIELVDARERRALWAGSFEAANEEDVSAGLVSIATEHLPEASLRDVVPKDPPIYLGIGRRGWGSGLTTAGLASVAGSAVLVTLAVQTARKLDTIHQGLPPFLDARDALRMRDTYRLQLVSSIALGTVGLASTVAGVVLLRDAAEQSVSVQFVPSHESGMLVFSGVF